MFLKNDKVKKGIEYYLSNEQVEELELYIKNLEVFDEYIAHTLIKNKEELNLLLSQVEKSFSPYLIELIARSGKTEVEIYKKANIDRKLFSKIKKNKNYHPSKNTVIVLALALELSLEATLELLEKAGYTLSHSIKKDLVVKYFIEKKIYDVDLFDLVVEENNLEK